MTAPHYGKRRAGALTAASPGDTIHFNFASYNDSGDSEALTGFAVTDIEVFKNGLAATRTTDSGYSLISDTGQIGDRVGLYRFSISLFNTADDTGHYESGAWYQVAVDSVTIDGKTVRFWAGSFEIGEPRANVVQVVADTGAAIHLQQVYANGFTDTGLQNRLDKIQSDVDTGLRTHISDVDTGLHDTLSDYDTGLRGILITTGVNLGLIRGDTGGADRFYRYTQKLDTGGDATVSASVDTGQVNQAVWQGNATRVLTANTNLANLAVNVTQLDSDTGFADRLGKFASLLSAAGQIDTGTGAADTGDLANSIWNGTRAAHTTAGTFGEYVNADVDLIRGDTGGADRFYRYTQKLDTGGDATVSASVDTGQVNQAVWQTNAQRKLTVDTGIADQVWKTATAGYNDDTGTFGELLRVSATTSVDTGQINQAVWQANAARSITNVADTGIVNSLQIIRSDVDTGLRTHIDDLDTGLHDTLADYDTGMRALLVLRDTGAIANAVWNFATRGITASSDTGINDRLGVGVTFDTGGWAQVNIRKVNSIRVQGTGDTGTPDTWRPGT